MQFAQSVGMLDRHFGSELPASFAGADLFASRAAIDPAAAFQFDQVSAIAQDNAVGAFVRVCFQFCS